MLLRTDRTSLREAAPREYRLLFDAMEPEPPAATNARLEGLDWDRVIFLAAWHRLAGLVSRHLGHVESVPADVADVLRKAYLAAAARSVIRARALSQVLDAFGREGIPAMLLKGSALVDTVYPDPALREMSDLDILVRKEQLDGANELLAALGYGRMRPVMREQDTLEWMRANHRHDPVLVDREGLVSVELHHHIVKGEPAAHFDIGDFWQRARPAGAGAPHLVPSVEDLLLHVCFHFTYHRKSRSNAALSQVADIVWLVHHEQVDWSRLVASARAYRMEPAIFLALVSARELGAPLPPEPLDALRPRDFDDRFGRRFVELRVLRAAPRGPLHSMRKTLTPSRYVLERGEGTGRRNVLSLARAYLRRAMRGLRFAPYLLREPRAIFQDYKLNGQFEALSRADPPREP